MGQRHTDFTLPVSSFKKYESLNFPHIVKKNSERVFYTYFIYLYLSVSICVQHYRPRLVLVVYASFEWRRENKSTSTKICVNIYNTDSQDSSSSFSKEFAKANLIWWLAPSWTSSTICNVIISSPLRIAVTVCLSHQTVGLPGFLDTDSSEINSLWQKELFNN